MCEPRIRVSAILRWRDRLLLCRHEKRGQATSGCSRAAASSAGESLVDALERELARGGRDRGASRSRARSAIVDSIAPGRALRAEARRPHHLRGRSRRRRWKGSPRQDAAVRGHRLFARRRAGRDRAAPADPALPAALAARRSSGVSWAACGCRETASASTADYAAASSTRSPRGRVGGEASSRSSSRRSAGPLADEGRRGRGHRGADRGDGAGCRRQPERPLLRLRDRRRAAGVARGRLARRRRGTRTGSRSRPRRPRPRWRRSPARMAASSCSACPRTCRAASSPAASGATRRVSLRRGTTCSPRAGWDLARDGLHGAPPIRVVVGEERHVTIDRALRLLGIGTASVVVVPADDQGRMRAGRARRRARRGREGPTIVCAQAGNVNTGAFDPLDRDRDACEAPAPGCTSTAPSGSGRRPARASAHLVAGSERADSWATDGHKWLNVPYDCGHRLLRAPRLRTRAAMAVAASYLAAGGRPEPVATGCPSSRAARAASPSTRRCARSAGSGVAEMVERCCDHAARFAELLGARARGRDPERRRAQPGPRPLR